MKDNYINHLRTEKLQSNSFVQGPLLFFVIFFSIILSSAEMVAQNPDYTYDNANSKNLDFFTVTIADAFNVQAKLNRLIISVDTNPEGEQFVLTFGNGIKKVGPAGLILSFST